MSVDHQTRPNRVEIPNDILIRDEDFCREVLGRCARRTAKRYECEGAFLHPDSWPEIQVAKRRPDFVGGVANAQGAATARVVR